MSEKSEEFIRVMLDFLPLSKNEYLKSIKDNGMVLETVIIEDIFLPEILKLMSDEKNTMLLQSIFDYFEEVCNGYDEHLLNIISITVFEILGNDKFILEKAQKYMGSRTKLLQAQADLNLGRLR